MRQAHRIRPEEIQRVLWARRAQHKFSGKKELRYGRTEKAEREVVLNEPFVVHRKVGAFNGRRGKNKLYGKVVIHYGIDHSAVRTMQGKLSVAVVGVGVRYFEIMQPQKPGERQIGRFALVNFEVVEQGRHPQYFCQQVVACGKLQNKYPVKDALHAVKIRLNCIARYTGGPLKMLLCYLLRNFKNLF